MIRADLHYRPTEEEPYMNHRQLTYFQQKLMHRKMELQEKASRLKSRIKGFKSSCADIIDRSNFYMDMERNLSDYDRYTRMTRQVDEALHRIANGRFGYCELTGEPIGLKRLEALPFTSMSVEALEAFENTGAYARTYSSPCGYQPCA